MDELWDEGAVAGDDAAVGAALLMADLEGAIAAAGDEIASLRRVTEAVPRPGLPPGPAGGEGARPKAAGGELARASPASVEAVHVLQNVPTNQVTTEPLPRVRGEMAVAAGLPVQAAAADTSVAALDRIAPVRATDSRLQAAAAAVVDPSATLPPSAVSLPADTSLRANAPAGRTPDRLPPSNDQAADVALLDATAPAWAAPVWPVAPVTEQSRDLPDRATPDQPKSPLAAEGISQAAPVRSLGATVRDAGDVGAVPSDRAGAEGPEPADTSHDETRSGPTEGDVYLDGERVGRWMARHLARELGGPQAAGTGFDPRLGPAWPGSLHGN